jgi:hypothetical protein
MTYKALNFIVIKAKLPYICLHNGLLLGNNKFVSMKTYMLKIKLAALMLTASILLMTLTVRAQNLVLNGGFETATVGLPGGTPFPAYPTFLNNWSAVDIDGEFMYDLSLAHTGTGFMSVLNNPGGNPVLPWLASGWNSTYGYDRAVQIVNVSPSTPYQLQFWCRSGAGLRYGGYDDGTLLVQVEEVTPVPATITTFTMTTPAAWQPASITFVTGSSCTSIAILFSVYDVGAADAWVDDVDLQEGKPTSVPSSQAAMGISVYQSMVSGELRVICKGTEELQLNVYDISGRNIISKSFSGNYSISLRELPAGIFFYSLANRSSILKSGKLVVN